MFSNPINNIKKLELSEGMKVADFGSGSGHYVMAASDIVGNSGRVYAVDIQKDLLKRIKNLAIKEGKNNIDILWGDIEQKGGTKLVDNFLDAVIIANTLFQTKEKNNTVTEISRVLKPKGKLLVVDWADSFGGLGPQPDDVVVESQARRLFETGFEFIERFDAGEHHYGLIFTKIY